MTGRVVALRPALVDQPVGLAASVVRDLLLAGPSGVAAEGRALIGLLDEAGLLGVPEFVGWCLEIECDPVDGTLLYADVAVDRLAVASVGESPVELPKATRRLLSAAVVLVDLAAELRELDPDARVIAVTALRYLEAVGRETYGSASSAGAPGEVSLSAASSGWSAARRLAGDLQRLDDLVTAAWRAEEELLELRADQVGVVAEAVPQRDRLLTGLIGLVRGVPPERVALTSPAHTAATSPTPSAAGGTR